MRSSEATVESNEVGATVLPQGSILHRELLAPDASTVFSVTLFARIYALSPASCTTTLQHYISSFPSSIPRIGSTVYGAVLCCLCVWYSSGVRNLGLVYPPRPAQGLGSEFSTNVRHAPVVLAVPQSGVSGDSLMSDLVQT